MSDDSSTILIIDDVQENRDLLQRRLQRNEYNVKVATDGLEGLEIMEKGGIDLVLLDIHMPIMDGVTVLEKIKNDDGLLDIPVVMLTAIDNMNVVHQCLRKGACGYVTKPFNMELLNQQIQHCLG